MSKQLNSLLPTKSATKRRVWLYKYPIDMRKQIDGLCHVISERMQQNPQSGDIYVFFGYRADKAKLLFWDGDGFVLIYKRLSNRRHFLVPNQPKMQACLTQLQLQNLLKGVE